MKRRPAAVFVLAAALACSAAQRTLPEPPAPPPASAPEAPSPAAPPEAPGAKVPEEVPQAAAPPPAADLERSAPDVTRLKRLDFRGGNPIVPIRLMEGRDQVSFWGRGRLRMRVHGGLEKVVESPARVRWTVRITSGRPAVLSASVQLGEFRFTDKAGLAAEQRQWDERGVKTRVHVLGTVFGISGKVIDNRRYLLLLDGAQPLEEARARQAEFLRTHGVRTTLLEQEVAPPGGVLELLDAEGSSVALGEGRISVEAADDGFIDVAQVEYGVGYDFHSFEDRTYRGALQIAVDRHGKLAAVNLIPLEELLNGLVPAEIFARSHPEALKAQAVTARGEVLAKIGTKHLADPYFLCSEQHCAVYRGLTGEALSTNAAVAKTRGEALFSADGRLVDSVYSAVCGGHTEHNDIVWGGPPNPSLRGRPDLIGPPARKLPDPRTELGAFLDVPQLPAACRLSSLTSPGKFRWERRFGREEVDKLTAHLGIGRVVAMAVSERGASGRVRLLTLSGEAGATQLRGELNIRRLFGMLNSGMFLVSLEGGGDGRPAQWVFRGGGWGHGVGMCQTGAIGRAEAGHGYHDILRHYYNGAEVARIY